MQHGSMVMPFDQNVAMHMFVPNASGGTMQIMVHDGDPKQVALVRTHLSQEAGKFRNGGFSDPAYVHGKNMPGLAALSAGAKRLQVTYAQTPTGARIGFRSSDPGIVSAIHEWLAAQDLDHNGGLPKHCDT